jgi:tRNA (cytosine38-C5)-methyltransferase
MKEKVEDSKVKNDLKREEKIIIAIEFFSGIGGLHYGLQYASQNSKVVAAFDTNTNANKVYAHNFHLQPSTKGIERLTASLLDKFKANMWLMSPPCQPYTAGGKRLDHEDNRAAGLLHLIKLLKEVERKPEYLFLENVPNFETSECRNRLVNTLIEMGYNVDEFLVSPLLVGIPNDRKRYYLCAKLENIDIPGVLNPLHRNLENYCADYIAPSVDPLASYLEELETVEPYLVKPADIRKRKNFQFDVVQPTSSHCSTFTKSYGHHHFFGSGSMLQTASLDTPYKWGMENEELIALKPRFFTPLEIARLHFFPKDGFSFPDSITTPQKYKLLGNSLNIKIVGVLIQSLLRISEQKRKRIKLD